MYPFFTAFFIFIVVLNLRLHRQRRRQEDTEQSFWDRESAANSTRRQDISTLNYINIPLEKIPQNLHTDSEKELVSLASETLLNLAGQTNTDLKLRYGVANLNALSQYDANFSRFVAVLPVYAAELIDAGQAGAARELLEFAVECRADSTRIFTMLAELYRKTGEEEKIDGLRRIAETYGSISGQMIVQALDRQYGTVEAPG